MDDESCHEREIFVLELDKENVPWKAAGRQARAHGTSCPIRLGLQAFVEQGRKTPRVGGWPRQKQPPAEPKGLVGSRSLSLDPVGPGCCSPISLIHGAQKLTVTPSQTPPALHAMQSGTSLATESGGADHQFTPGYSDGREAG